MQVIDGIQRHEKLCSRCKDTRRLIESLGSRGGFLSNGVAILFVLNEARPCKSRVIREYWEDNRVTVPATAQAIAEGILREGWVPVGNGYASVGGQR